MVADRSASTRLEGACLRLPSDRVALVIITVHGDGNFDWVEGCAGVDGFNKDDQLGRENRRHHQTGEGQVDGSWHPVSWVMRGLIALGRASRARLLVGVDAGAFSGTARGLPARPSGSDDTEPPGRWITFLRIPPPGGRLQRLPERQIQRKGRRRRCSGGQYGKD